MPSAAHYDEFGLFHENAQEFGLPFDAPPTVTRESVVVGDDGRRLSALRWGNEPADLVLLHGGAQNAHTWDTVALALDRPLVAIDLPGHGHSDHRGDGPFSPRDNAADIAVAIAAIAPDARMVVGMSLGGLTSIALAALAPELVRRLTLVDVTPGVDRDKAAPIAQFIAGPDSFESFDEILDRTIEFNPTRSESSLRRGILHNAVPRDDGRWVWRYQRPRLAETADIPADFATLWDDVSGIAVPVMLARGGAAESVVDDGDVAELLRRQPDARVEVVEGAGHSIQGDRPLELAALLVDFVDS
ncbi:MAG TPA: alpha/beta hydrolase [Acidimicrobiia bacterium]|nr:alpha/beta hydrolase [Acidimicrobiia bacterium]